MNYFNEPTSSPLALAFRRLTIVRLVAWLSRFVWKTLTFVSSFLFKIVRSIFWFFLDIAYEFKNKQSPWPATPEVRVSVGRRVLGFLFSALWAIPKSLVNLFSRMREVSVETAHQGEEIIRREIKEQRGTVSLVTKKPSVAWSLFNFVLTLIVIIIPVVIYGHWRGLEVIKAKVLASANKAVGNLLSAQTFLEERNIPEAQHAFSEAGQNFLTAQSDLSAVNSFLLEAAGVLPNQSARLAASGQHLIRAGELSSRLGEQLSGALVLPTGQTPTVSAILQHFVVQAEPALPVAQELEQEMSKVKVGALPQQYQAQFTDFSHKVKFIASSLEEAIRLAKQANLFLGEKMDKRYMLVFQNNTEKRGPGGFIGSFALVDIRRGEITKLTVPKGGTYDTEAGLTHLVTAPEPLHLLNPLWHFWDANWWPDWPTSAKKLMWFYENSNGPTVDGVISLTPTVLERVLGVIGPIDMTKDYGVVIDEHNFWSVTQTFSEQKPHVTTEPKKIIGDLINRLMEEVPKRMTPEKTVQLITVLEQALEEKQILPYFTDPDLEQTVQELGWSGSIANTKGDYLMVVNSNIGGQKTDKVITENLNHQARILPDGGIIDTLTIRRQHEGVKGETFVGVRNVDWLRVYVPEGSRLLSATGFRTPDGALFEAADPSWESDPDLALENAATLDSESLTKVYTEHGKTVFANWSMVDPGETETITLQYELPFVIKHPPPQTGWRGWLERWLHTESSLEYSLLAQKQPGALTTTLHSSVHIESPVQIRWTYPTTAAISQGWDLSRSLDTDFFGAVLYK